MSEIVEIPKCNCDSHNNSVCDVCQIYIPEIERLKGKVKELKEKLAIKDDVICASKLIIEAYEKQEAQGE